MRSLHLLVLSLGLTAACDKGPPKTSEAAAAKTAQAGQTGQTGQTGEPAPAAAAAPKGQTFGAGVKLAASTPIDAILGEPTKFAGKSVRVEGMVTDVCEMRGCWFEMAGDKPGAKLRFKVTDGDMVFPMESKGKKAVAEGVVAVKELTLDQTKEYEEEQAREKNAPFDPAKVTEPMRIVRLDGTGAVFLN
jgi:hypothetical protein